MAFVFPKHALAPPSSQVWWMLSAPDLPSCYFVTDGVTDGIDALETYCDLMEDWVRAIRDGSDRGNVFPVKARPTLDNVAALESRIETLRDEIIPALSKH